MFFPAAVGIHALFIYEHHHGDTLKDIAHRSEMCVSGSFFFLSAETSC